MLVWFISVGNYVSAYHVVLRESETCWDSVALMLAFSSVLQEKMSYLDSRILYSSLFKINKVEYGSGMVLVE